MIDLTVKTLDSRNHSFSLEDNITVREFKENIAESVAVPADSQRLIYCGRVLQDEKKLIEYDVNGKVIHLVQRAPPQSGQRGNNSGQGQDQDQGQGQGRHTHRPHFRDARAQVRLPRIDGNAMYLGAMSFPADAESQAIPNAQLWSREAERRLAFADQAITWAQRAISALIPGEANPVDDPCIPPFQEQLQEPEQEQTNQDQAQEQELEQRQEQDQEFASSETGGNGAYERLVQAGAAMNTAFLPTRLNNFSALSTAMLSGPTLPVAQTDGGNNPEGVETAAATPNPNDIGQSEQPQTTQQQQQQQVPPQPQGSESRQQEEESATGNAQRESNAPRRPAVPSPQVQMGRLIGRLMHFHERLKPYLERYQEVVTLSRDCAWPAENGPGSVLEAERVVNGLSDCLHNLSHASHAMSDIMIDLHQPPPRTLRCRPNAVQHSALLQAGIPIQVEAHISLHGRNQNADNNNESGSTTAPASDATPAAQESGESSVPTNEAPQQQQPETGSQRQQQQQPPTFGTLFNVPHNVEVLMEVGPEIGSNDQNQQNFGNRNNNNDGSPGGISAGIFPWGASPTSDLMRSLMQMVAGQVARGAATVTPPNRSANANSNTSSTGEQQATNSDGSSTVASATVEGSNSSNPGQSTQARGNTGTHPTTSTQTRSTPRPHIFHSNLQRSGLWRHFFDPFLPCNSHHIWRPLLSFPVSANNNAPPQQQQATQNSAANDQNQTATSAEPFNSDIPTRESNTSSENSTPAPPPQAANNLPIVNLLTQILSGVGARGGQNQTGPGGWMQLFNGGIPVLQNLMANSSNQAGSGMTLMDLLENTPGLGVSTNIGIIGPLRMDQTVPGEDLLFDLVVTVVQNITLEGWEALRTGHWEPLTGIRRPLREFFQNFFGSTSLSGSEDRVVDRLISELQPTLDQLLLEDTNAREEPEMDVDLPATIERLLRRHFLNILRLLFDNDVDDTRFAQGLLASIKTLQTEACSALQYSFRGRQLRIETVAHRIVTRLTEDVEPGIRRWIVNSCVSQVCSYLVHMTQLPDNEVVPLLVLKTAPAPAPPTPIVQQHRVLQTELQPEPMETDVVEERVEVEPLEVEEGATFPGHEAVPSDWVPIIARDGVRQRRQLQVQMQSQGMTGSGVGNFSDAYLGGMPSKRRKLIEQHKPRILLSPTPNHSSVSISMERLVRESVGRAGIVEVEGAAGAVATDVGVRRAFGEAIRGCLYQHPRRQTSPDFPDPMRFPNATKYFAKNDENSKK